LTVFGGSGDEKARISVAMTLISGEKVHGQLFLGLGGKLADYVNRDQTFFEFERRDGTSSSLPNLPSVKSPRPSCRAPTSSPAG
jgi:hypothetical protein